MIQDATTTRSWAFGLALLLLVACGSSSEDTPGTGVADTMESGGGDGDAAAQTDGSTGSGGQDSSTGGTPGTGGTQDIAEQGAKGGGCFPNGTCNTGLVCTMGNCLESGAVPGTGGCTAKELANACPDAACGVEPKCGQDCGGCPAGQACLGSGCQGASVLCNDTRSDPMNCGGCGNVCRSQDDGACVDGVCQPSFGECIEEPDADVLVTCDDSCAVIGETCVPNACSNVTSRSWTSFMDPDCELNTNHDAESNDSCDAPIVWNSGLSARCCCTDTP